MRRSRFGLAGASALGLALALASCGDDGAMSDAGPDGGPDAGPVDGGPILCTSSGVERFLDVDRACDTVADCFAATLQTDCCGSIRVTGIAASEQTTFEEAAEICRSMYPDCDCAPMPTSADDGSTGMPADVTVECITRICRTTFL